MPTFGTLELTAVVDRLATVRDLDTEAWSPVSYTHLTLPTIYSV